MPPSIPTKTLSAVPTPKPLRTPSGADVDRVLKAALLEDLGLDGWDGSSGVRGDVTSASIPAERVARGELRAKERGIVAGLGVFTRCFELLDPDVRSRLEFADGDEVAPGDVLAVVEGRARSLLAAERTALNFAQRLSGIATLTRRYVERAAGIARILDTRKTTPGLRVLEKYAVRCGGGENHRMGLYDEAMVKNNHVDLAQDSLEELVRRLRREHGDAFRITAEARDADEALQGVRGGADVLLLDNLSAQEIRALCPRLLAAAERRGRPLEIEASGGIRLEDVEPMARAGVDRISVGALTHSAPALDLSLRLEARA